MATSGRVKRMMGSSSARRRLGATVTSRRPGLLAGQPRQKKLGGVGHLNEHAGVVLQPQRQQPQRQGIGKLSHLAPGKAPPGVHQRLLPGDAACVVIAEIRRRLERHVTRDRIP